MKLRRNVTAMIDAMSRRSRNIGKSMLAKKPAYGTPPSWHRPVRCCTFCSAAPDFFMAEDEVWEEAGLDKKELVCLSCFQSNLGRKLVITDFTNAQINLPIVWAFRMGIEHAQANNNSNT